MSDSGYQLRLLKQLLSLLAKEESSSGRSKDKESGDGYASGAKDMFSNLAGLAGKGKDELIQSICREIGLATAAVLKEPIAHLLKDRKLQVTIEFVPVKNNNDKEREKAPTPNPRKPARESKPKDSNAKRR